MRRTHKTQAMTRTTALPPAPAGRRRRPLVEPLEGRAYCSMTIDLRVASTGGKTATVSVGQSVTIDVDAVISGSTAGSNDAFLDLIGSFIATKGSGGSPVGNLNASLQSGFTANGSSDGTDQDLNGDGGIDVGSTNTTTTDGYFVARSGDVDYSGTVSGDTNTFLLATLTYTVTTAGTGGSTGINFVAAPSIGGSYSAFFVQDGSGITATSFDSQFLAGAPVTITTPTSTPTPTTTQLTGTTYGTPGSFDNDGNTIYKATDGNLSTFFDAPTANGSAVGINLGSAQTVSQIKFLPRSGYASRMVGGVFQASSNINFTSNVVTVYTVTSTPSQGLLTAVNTNTSTAYQYWRYVGPNGSYCNIAEFQLFGSGTGVSQLTGTTYGTPGSYGNSGNTIYNATDGNLNTYFDAPTANGSAVGINLGSAKTVSQIEFAPRSGYASRMVGGMFQASNNINFTSGVVTVYTVTSTPAQGTLTTISTGTSTAYQYWRYIGPNGSYCNIAEFQLFG